MVIEKTKMYSTRLLVQFMVQHYRHENSRMCNIIQENGRKRVCTVSSLPNQKHILISICQKTAARYRTLMAEIERNNKEKLTLRRSSGSGQKRRLLNARVSAFNHELKVRHQNDIFFEKWGSEVSDP